MSDQIQQLIDILLDKEGREDERSDAAMYLGSKKDIRALEALAQVASNEDEPDDIVDDCACSFAEISIANDTLDETLVEQMIPFAQQIVVDYIMNSKPELIKPSFLKRLGHKNQL